jgi:O-antigen ligase
MYKYKPLFFEKLFTVASLIAFTQALVPLFLSGGGSAATLESSRALQLLWISIYGVTFFISRKRIFYFLGALLKEKTILAVVFFAVISISWSIDPALTLKRSFALIGTTYFGVYFALRYNIKEQIHLLGIAFGLCCFLSLIFVIFIPSYGLMSYSVYQGVWRGVFTHKNTLARFTNFSSLIFLILALEARTKKIRVLWYVLLLLSLLLLVMSTGKAALVSLIALLSVFPFVRVMRWSYGYALPFIMTVSIIAFSAMVLLSANLDAIFQLLGKDSDLTGRTDLWPDVIDAILDRPLLGYGYSSFWRGWTGPSGDIWNLQQLEWTPPHAHNGFLDLSLDIGLVGLTVYIVGYVISIIKSIIWVSKSSSIYNYWPFIVTLSTVVFNITESVIMKQNNIYWLLYVSMVIYISVRKKLPSSSFELDKV